MFTSSRIFFENDLTTGQMQWFFQTREGLMGPYISREHTEKKLAAFIRQCMETANTGGRGPGTRVSPLPQKPQVEEGLTLLPMENPEHDEEYRREKNEYQLFGK